MPQVKARLGDSRYLLNIRTPPPRVWCADILIISGIFAFPVITVALGKLVLMSLPAIPRIIYLRSLLRENHE